MAVQYRYQTGGSQALRGLADSFSKATGRLGAGYRGLGQAELEVGMAEVDRKVAQQDKEREETQKRWDRIYTGAKDWYDLKQKEEKEEDTRGQEEAKTAFDQDMRRKEVGVMEGELRVKEQVQADTRIETAIQELTDYAKGLNSGAKGTLLRQTGEIRRLMREGMSHVDALKAVRSREGEAGERSHNSLSKRWQKEVSENNTEADLYEPVFRDPLGNWYSVKDLTVTRRDELNLSNELEMIRAREQSGLRKDEMGLEYELQTKLQESAGEIAKSAASTDYEFRLKHQKNDLDTKKFLKKEELNVQKYGIDVRFKGVALQVETQKWLEEYGRETKQNLMEKEWDLKGAHAELEGKIKDKSLLDKMAHELTLQSREHVFLNNSKKVEQNFKVRFEGIKNKNLTNREKEQRLHNEVMQDIKGQIDTGHIKLRGDLSQKEQAEELANRIVLQTMREEHESILQNETLTWDQKKLAIQNLHASEETAIKLAHEAEQLNLNRQLKADMQLTDYTLLSKENRIKHKESVDLYKMGAVDQTERDTLLHEQAKNLSQYEHGQNIQMQTFRHNNEKELLNTRITSDHILTEMREAGATKRVGISEKGALKRTEMSTENQLRITKLNNKLTEQQGMFNRSLKREKFTKDQAIEIRRIESGEREWRAKIEADKALTPGDMEKLMKLQVDRK